MWNPRFVLLVGALGLTAGMAACAMPMRSVRFATTPADWEKLAGDWRGEYWMRAYDRHGTIAFKLVAATGEASGDGLMISDRFGWPYQGYPPKPGMWAGPVEPRTQLLTIRFVRADRDQISGHMDPYWDPDRHCRASASFLGSVDGNVIRGTLSSVCDEGGRPLTGRWKVERKRSPDRP
jgi:hypothetical protein